MTPITPHSCFFKPLRFFLKTVLNGTTTAVGDIQRHHTEQFSNYSISSCSIISNTNSFRITNE